MSFDSVSPPMPNPLLPKSPAPSVHGGSTSSLRSSVLRDMPSSPRIQRTGSIRINGSAAAGHARRSAKPRAFYPMEYGRHMRDMEIWDNTFFTSASGRHTLTPTEHIPPGALILDIACGYGSWTIMAARDQPDYQIVGFDKANIQPDLKRLGLDDLAQRVTWVHGDMLEDLPFPSAHFDVVRAPSIGLCVPETKWGALIEEIARVLKPGGVFETPQEALIFPCPRFAPREVPKDHRASHAVAAGARARANTEMANIDPRDHSKVKAAFDAMLEVRFLNPKIISSLPFYMNAHFTNVHITPTVRVMIPPSSFIRGLGELPSGDAAEPQALAAQHISITDLIQMEQHAVNSEVIVEQGGQMHLTHTMNTILACKQAMWEQFEALNPALTRIDFDYLMKNWEMDMRDRIDMRGTLVAGLGWSPPTDREDPEHRAWRENMIRLHQAEGMWDAQPIPEACRALRGFIGFKAKDY